MGYYGYDSKHGFDSRQKSLLAFGLLTEAFSGYALYGAMESQKIAEPLHQLSGFLSQPFGICGIVAGGLFITTPFLEKVREYFIRRE